MTGTRGMPAQGSTRRRTTTAMWAVAGLAVAVNVAYLASTALVDRAGGGVTAWDRGVQPVAILLPAAVVLVWASLDRRVRSGHLVLAAAITAFAVGKAVFSFHDGRQVPVPVPGWSDAAYLVSYLLVAVALTAEAQRQSGHASHAARLDGLVVGLAAASVTVALWFEPILDRTGSVAAVVVGMAYPLFDLVFLVVVVSGAVAAGGRPRASTVAVALGALSLAVGDVVYLHQLGDGTYRGGTPLEATWMLGLLLLGLAPLLSGDRRPAPGRTVSPATVLPGVASVLALVVVALGFGGRLPAAAVDIALAALAVVLVRGWLTVRELRHASGAFLQARTDDLTGLSNRRGFAEELDRRLAEGVGALGVVLVDLDGFKEVNDSLGHQAGDRLLSVLGQRFLRAVPAPSFLARLGGDEFGLIVPGETAVCAAAADTLLGCLDDPVALDRLSVRVGASAGIAVAPWHGTTPEDLVRAADVAMYQAKGDHLRFALYAADRDPHSRDRLALIEDLRTAVQHRRFEMYYQPKVEVATGRVVGIEALIRWNHPERGPVPPADFIPLAERIGLIPAITRVALEVSVADLAQIRRTGLDLRLSVNVSGRDLVDDELPAYVRSLVDAHGLPPSLLTLEITETALSSDLTRADRTVRALRAAGMRISIDDFGVGYSSMAQLLQLPVDELKLDRSFIANLDRDLRARAILSAAVELGRTLGLEVVAEGVETPEALQEVAERHVDTVQGYLFSRALPVEELVRFVHGHRPRPVEVAARAGPAVLSRVR